MYIPLLLAFSLAKSFWKIENFYYLSLPILKVDGGVAVSINDRVIKIVHWRNPSGKWGRNNLYENEVPGVPEKVKAARA
jgi:hypothetical protein